MNVASALDWAWAHLDVCPIAHLERLLIEELKS
jgi:hypothetical protein